MELGWRKVDFYARLSELAALQVDLDFTSAEDRFLGCFVEADAAENGSQTGEEFAEAERLGHEVVGAGLQGLYLFVFRIADCDHDDADAGDGGANATAGVSTGHPRHVDVEGHEH